jgi:3-methyladenine DNA glycosylase/8-oxoguanine DNA glycosylase
MRRIHDEPRERPGRVREARVLRVEVGDVDPLRSLALHRLGERDGGTARGPDTFDKVFRAPQGPARLVVSRHEPERGVVDARLEADAEDLDALATALPAVLGLADPGPTGEWPRAEGDPRRVLRDARAKARGLRLVRVPWLYELLVVIVLQQRVAHVDAMRSYRWLLRELGEPYPEDPTRRTFPSPLLLSRVAPEAFRAAGVDRERAERLRIVGRVARHLPRIAALPLDEARVQLGRVRGLGPWSIEHFLGAGLGDADAVPTGDYWLPHQVSLAHAGEPRADDRRMLELLEPLRPHRYRALLWLMAAGVAPVRYGPRMRPAGPPR